MSKDHIPSKPMPTYQFPMPAGERLFLRAKDAAAYLSFSKSHFHVLVRDGILPEGKMVSGAIRVWKRAELDVAADKMWEG